jgi:fructose-1,6-bisphosphatase II / sedoheptulose-1,7-bisphosphatase
MRMLQVSHATPPHDSFIDRNLAIEVVRVTEAAALAASLQVGRGDEMAADLAAVEWMHRTINALSIEGRIVIGEHQEAPLLAVGHKIGAGGPLLDVALDPLEGATITAKGGENALSVVAMAQSGAFFNPPDVYMDKIAVGPGLPPDVLDLDAGPQENLRRLAGAKGGSTSELLVCILDRPRHNELISQVREAGARIMLISDGDVSGVIATTQPQSGVDIYMGSGGAAEGILAAAALRCIGGQMQARLHYRNDDDKARAHRHGIDDLYRKYTLEELVGGDVMFAATGVTNGAMLRGVRRFPGGALTHSIVMRSRTGTVRWIESHHDFRRKTFGLPGEG